jgi:hypothetical protein
MTLLSAEALAQDTTLARIPQVELTPVHQREVMDHYINKVWTSKGWQIETFDGAKESVLSFGQQALIAVSPNQRYFTVAKLVTSTTNKTVAYNVELRDLANSLLAKGRVSALGSEEGDDEFVPANNGLGLIQQAYRPLSGSLGFAVFKCQKGQLLRTFAVDKLDFVNGSLSYEPAQQMIVVAFERHTANTEDNKTFLQCFSPDGTLRWETVLNGQYIKSQLFISAFDGTVSFVCRDMRDETHKNLFLFDKNGKMLRQLSVYRGGLYKRSYFHTANGRQYLLSPSDGEFYYVIDAERGEIINRQTQGKKESYVTGLAMFQQYIVTTYFTGGYRPGPNNTQEFAITEQGLGIQDAFGSVTYIPLDLTGEPFLVASKAGMFLREKLGHGEKEINKFYKINLK